MPKPGYVYVATDEMSPAHCKVGKTRHVEQREKELNNGQPDARIKIADFVWVDDMDTVERAFHKILKLHRKKGEWFNIEKDDVLPMLECVGKPAERRTRFEGGPTDRVGERGRWHEAGWQMHCGGKTQAEIAEKFGVTQGAVVWMKRKMRGAGRGNEEEHRLRRSVPGAGRQEGKQGPGCTPQSAFREPIVEVLKELGGKGQAKDVVERVGRRMQRQLRHADYKHRKNRQIVWVNNVHWERKTLQSEGILKSNSPHGWWELA